LGLVMLKVCIYMIFKIYWHTQASFCRDDYFEVFRSRLQFDDETALWGRFFVRGPRDALVK